MRVMKRIHHPLSSSLFGALLLLGASGAWAADPAPKPSSFSAMFAEPEARYELKIDPHGQKADLTLWKTKGETPIKVSLYLTGEHGQSPTYDLKSGRFNDVPHFRGELGDARYNYAGVVLKLEFPNGRNKILRSSLKPGNL